MTLRERVHAAFEGGEIERTVDAQRFRNVVEAVSARHFVQEPEARLCE
jgi:hypothetical protein